MGEGKRRKQQGRQFADALRERIAAGEFGPAGGARQGYLLVVDKSQRGKDALLALRTVGELDGLQPLLDGDALRLWEASALFRYAVLCGGTGSADRRTLMAPDLDKLLHDALPKALARMQGVAGPLSAMVAVDDADQAAVQQAAQRLLDAAAR